MISLITERPELFNDWRFVWSGTWSTYALVSFAVLLFVALLFSWWASARLPFLWQRLTSLFLRFLAAGVFLLLLAGPSIELRHVQKVQNYFLTFLDLSASMMTRFEPQGPTHLDKMKAFFRNNASTFKRLKDDQRLRFFSFAEKVNSLQPQRIPSLRATGFQTDLLKIARYVEEHYREKPLAGLLLVTDGIDTLNIEKKKKLSKKRSGSQKISRRMQNFVQRLAKWHVPVHLVVPSPPSALRDIAVADIYGDAFAFLHNTATIEVKIIVRGFPSAKIPVSLYREGKLLKSTLIYTQEKRRHYIVSFKFKPRKPGKFIYSIRVPVMRGEAIAKNNQKTFILKIIRDRIRVLQVVGRPSWDVRFLRRLLKKNANIDLISFFILRTNRSSNDVPIKDIALIPFPARELFTKTLPTFDLVIFQNFNYGPYLRRYYLSNIEKFVRKGGAFIMIGGELSFGAGGYLGTMIERILPVRLGFGRIDSRSFRPKLTSIGRYHPITRLLTAEKDNAHLWQQFPQVTGTNLVLDPKPSSLVLLEHPFLKTLSGRSLPILTVGFYGKGRVLALTIDQSWHWNFKNVEQGRTSAPYYRFWNNAIRWLIRDPELERIQITNFQTSYQLGKAARFRIKVFDKKYQPLRQGRLHLAVQDVSKGKILHRTTKNISKNGMIAFAWRPSHAGMYRLKVKLAHSKIRGEELFQVRGAYDEFQQIYPNYPLFSLISKKTHGKIYHFDDFLSRLPLKPPTIIRVDRSRTVDLWDNIYLLSLLFFLLFLEWMLRRRWGLM